MRRHSALLAGVALVLVGCGPRQQAVSDDDLLQAPIEDLVSDPEDTPAEAASLRPPGRAPRLREPLPDGWPREPVEPLSLKTTTRTLIDHADPIARFVVDLASPGTFELELATEKATDFKARVVLYDSLGTTLETIDLGKTWKMEPRDMMPGTLYLLVERRGGVAELVVKARFSGEEAPEE